MSGNVDTVAALIKELGAFGARKLRKKLLARAADPVERVDRAVLEGKMRAAWRAMGCSEATQAYFLRDAFSFQGYQDVIRRAREQWGPLSGKRVLDVGCGWGSLAMLLEREGAIVTFVDQTDAQVEVTGLRLASGTGRVGDVRRLTEVFAPASPRFDLVFAHSVIEHVGNPRDHRGDALPGLEAKRQLLEQMAHLLVPGGGAYVSTGNYAFPLDGEIKTWFFHWLPAPSQACVLAAMGIQADNYGLLTWTQLESLATSAGLVIDGVQTDEVGHYVTLLKILSALMIPVGPQLPKEEISELGRLMKSDPHFMPSWHVFLRRPGR